MLAIFETNRPPALWLISKFSHSAKAGRHTIGAPQYGEYFNLMFWSLSPRKQSIVVPRNSKNANSLTQGATFGVQARECGLPARSFAGGGEGRAVLSSGGRAAALLSCRTDGGPEK